MPRGSRRFGKLCTKPLEYLRRSAAVRRGTDRGLTLKALLQALVSQQVAGVLPESAEVRRLASEAKSLLPADRYATQRAEIENLLSWNLRESNEICNKGIDLSDARTFLKKPISEWLKEQKPREVIELFTQTAEAVSDKDARLALDLWLAALPLIVSEDDQIKESSFRQGIQFMQDALVPKAALRVRGKRITERAKAADQMVKKESWDSRTRAAVLFSLAVASTISAEEAQGLELLQQGIEASPELATLLSPPLQWFKGVLQTGAAVNALDQGNAKDAAQHYMMGAITFLDGHQPRIAWDLILRTIDLGLNRDADALVPFVAGIGRMALDLENQLGDSTMISLQYYYRQVLARLVQQGANNALMLVFLLLAAKGNRFANALARRGGTPWLETEEAQRMLLSINDPLRTVSSEARFFSMLDDEMLLTAYVSSQEMKGGTTEVERLRNLQIHFDAELNRQLVTQPAAPEWIPTIESLQETLGAQSVLLCYFVGTGPKMGGLAVYTLILTNQDVRLMVGASDLLPSATVTMSDGEEMIAGNWLSLDIKALREALQLEPGPRTASGEALDGLAKDQGQYLGGGLPELLAHLRESGKDHLCIAPHGPLHFYPFHLLGPEGKALSETWNVTYLPNLRLLDPSRKTPTTDPKLGLTAIGLDFDTANPRGLPQLSGAEAEAAAIAKTFGTQPVTGAAATKLAVLEAFANSQRIHLASHGEHRVSAPAFQCIYLAGCEGEDVLYSYELLRLDLHGVDLVTLSACETALGRFDVSDNLRGFSASLLIAGVSTIIGTLWPIETNAAAFFFEHLYTALQRGSGKGHAFHAAQLETQSRFPQYRDWGAFYLAGAWL
jgi:hypothetical protein